MKVSEVIKEASKWTDKEIEYLKVDSINISIEVLIRYAKTDDTNAGVRLLKLLKALGFT